MSNITDFLDALSDYADSSIEFNEAEKKGDPIAAELSADMLRAAKRAEAALLSMIKSAGEGK